MLLKYANYHFSLDLVVGLNDLIATVLNSYCFFYFQISENGCSKVASAASESTLSSEPLSSFRERHVTVGESSGCEETVDSSSRDQPRAFIAESSTEHETESEEGMYTGVTTVEFQK